MNEKIIRERTVCFTGHRSEKLPKGDALERLRQRLSEEIEKAIQDGYDTFLFGGAYGFDLMAAEEVLKKKVLIDLQNPRHIRLIAIIPFEEQAVRFSVADHERYYEIMPKCDEVIRYFFNMKNATPTKKAQTVSQRSFPRKRRSSNGFTPATSRGKASEPSLNSSTLMTSSPTLRTVNGRKAP